MCGRPYELRRESGSIAAITAVSVGSAMTGRYSTPGLPRLLRQPRENPVPAAVPAGREAVLCQAIQPLLRLLYQPEEISVSAVPAAPRVSFQPLSANLAYSKFTGNSEDSEI